MVYIIVALKAEAQAFVDKFKLKNYQNDHIKVVISGIGSKAMKEKTIEVLKAFDKKDKILNIGICGANENYTIGELIDARQEEIICVDYEMKNHKYSIVDMESAGFIEATMGIEESYIFKIVSDHFEPHKVTKDKSKQLIFNQIDEIMKRINNA